MKASSFKRYILYAVGEVILILRGVHISFSLNNSNNFWVKRLQEQQIVVRISDEFNAGINQISSSQDRLRCKKEARQSLGPFVRGKVNDDKRSFLEGVILVSNFDRGHPPLEQTTFRELLNSGQLGLILDTELSLQLNLILPLLNPKLGAIQSANKSIS
jgi:hypothetical protein